MKRIGNDKETRRILAQKLNETYGQESTSANPFSSDVDQLIEAAEAEYARQQKAKKRRRLGSIAAVFVAFALMSSGYILGMKADSDASANLTDEKKVVQQGDNIVIGIGASEDDENVGVVTKTYYSLEDVPENLKDEINFITGMKLRIDEIKIISSQKSRVDIIYYIDSNEQHIVITEMPTEGFERIIFGVENEWSYEGITVYKKYTSEGINYFFQLKEKMYTVLLEKDDDKKIEALIRNLMH